MHESKATAVPFYLLQVRAFQCSARCCEDRSSSQVVVQSCLQDCMSPVVEAESRIKEEVQQLQVLVSYPGTMQKIDNGLWGGNWYWSWRNVFIFRYLIAIFFFFCYLLTIILHVANWLALGLGMRLEYGYSTYMCMCIRFCASPMKMV